MPKKRHGPEEIIGLLCLPTALGCQLLEAGTSVRRRFLGSS